MRLALATPALMAMMLLLSACIGSGENTAVQSNGAQQFPDVAGIDLLGEERALPGSMQGTLNIVAVAFEREHQTPVNTWIPVAEDIMQSQDEVRFYEIPVIYEMNAAGRFWVNNGMRSGIPDDEARERTITVYTDRDKFTDLLAMQMDRIYLLLVDNDGAILWRTEGQATDETIQQLWHAINKALSS